MTSLKTEMEFNIPRKPALKQQYRTSMGILSEIMQIIMDAGMEGVIVSELSRKSNLSYSAAVENCQKLIDASLIGSTRKGRNYIFVITSKGIEFFREFKRFQEITNGMNLRC
ncbi:MAG: winged helix-turn-helix domain-containing protein, partial [Nitrosopumilaceae archaeon]